MAIIISDDLIGKTGLSEKELKTDFACWLYAQEKLSLARGAAFLGITRMEMQEELSKREINIHYSEADVMEDLSNLSKIMN